MRTINFFTDSYVVRQRIYQYLMPIFREHDIPYEREIDYQILAFQLQPRLLSRTIKEEFESILRSYLAVELHKKPFTISIQPVTVDFPRRSSPMDAIFCVPEDARSLHHRDPVLYAKSVVGLYITAAAKNLPFQSGFFESTNFRNTEEITTDRYFASETITANYHRLEGFIMDMSAFLSTAVLALRCNPHIRVNIQLPEWKFVDLTWLVAVVHDLRYVADNKYLSIEVHGRAEKDDSKRWKEWLKMCGGEHVSWNIIE